MRRKSTEFTLNHTLISKCGDPSTEIPVVSSCYHNYNSAASLPNTPFRFVTSTVRDAVGSQTASSQSLGTTWMFKKALNITEAAQSEEGITKESVPLTSEYNESEMVDDDEFENGDGSGNPYAEQNYDCFEVYQDDMRERSTVSNYFRKISGYRGGFESTSKEADHSEQNKEVTSKNKKLGTLMGVYFPCVQNIFGVLLFLRLIWMVGVAGILQTFIIVFICCLSTFLTSISLSAIATNGVVPAGGSYFMISRNLGPEFGGAVGILFYLGNTVASAMYIIGAVEIFLKYMAPEQMIFSDIISCYRVYGLALLVMIASCVMIGIRFVSKFAIVSLFCVLFSIFCIYIGIFSSLVRPGPKVCRLGDRLLASNMIKVNGTLQCHKEVSGPIYKMYCQQNYSDSIEACQYFKNNKAVLFDGIPGLASGLIKENGVKQHFASIADVIYDSDPLVIGNKDRGEAPAIADIATTFFALIAIYFPSVTGIMAGSNRSGDLANPQYSIPRGTIAATVTTSTIYLSCVLFFGACVDGRLMRDKFGLSIDQGLVVANLAWPHPWVILIGCFLSTIGAALQSLTGAPRLLQAISKDGIIPFLNTFQYTTKRGEPLYAQLLTFGICSIAICIGSIDQITPLITMFFLMCYAFVNLATAVNSLLKEPSWRPSFKYYHWSLSVCGVLLCVTLMFISAWYFAFVSIFVAGICYVYIAYKGAAQEWGDATHGLSLSFAKKALLRLDVKQPHTKNWRPQILVLLEMNDNLQLKHPRLLDLTFQLKAGKGLTIASTLLCGEVDERFNDMEKTRQLLRNELSDKKVKGIAKVVTHTNVIQGLNLMVQSAGLGGLEHNTVLLSYPNIHGSTDWDTQKIHKFTSILRASKICQKSILVPKGIDSFDVSRSKGKIGAYLDVWWIVNDGGLLFLLAFLLSKNRIYSKCKIRIFTVALHEDNNITLENNLKTYIKELRLNAQVKVVDVRAKDITAFTIDRTVHLKNKLLAMKEQRGRLSCDDQVHEHKMNHDFTASSKGDDDACHHSMSNNEAFTPEASVKLSKKKIAAPANEFLQTGSCNVGLPEVRRMHSAIKLNQIILEQSQNSRLVILNMPAPPPAPNESRDCEYMEYLETITFGMERVLLVRGNGREVLTIYS